MSEFPKHIILPDKVYSVFLQPTTHGRAFDRYLWDHVVKGENPLNPSDAWRTRLGSSRQLADDYASYRLPIPLEWILVRFLSHYVRTNSVHIISGPGGEVLKSTNVEDYLGSEISDDDVEQLLRSVFGSWVRVFPNEYVTLADIYGSTDIPFDVLKRGINYLIHLGHIEETGPDTYIVKASIFDKIRYRNDFVSLDRKSNHYYQEVRIEASEPFCFIIMPFRESEFPQRIYTEVIKPFIENNFKIACHRVDEDCLPDRIDNKIYSYLMRAAFIIAEVTTCNPNVFYELGLAHMLEKDCIILTQKSASEIPFDINRIRAEKYGNEDALVEILRKAISALAFKLRT